MCHEVVSEKLVMLKHYSERYKTQKMCDKAVDACLSALKIVPDFIVTSKMIEILHNLVFPDDNIDLDYTECDIVAFFS